MIRFKQGTKVFGIRPEVVMAILVAEGVYKTVSTGLVLTSVNDGRHSLTSLHYSGNAVDIRTRELDPDHIEEIGEEIRQSLTSEYDVVVESDHIHIEFQPKRSS